jgi:hypothetical protein
VLAAVQSGDRPISLGIVGHLDEPKAPGLSRVAIRHYADPLNGSMSFKQGAETVFRGPKTEVSNKYILHRRFILFRFDGQANWADASAKRSWVLP